MKPEPHPPPRAMLTKRRRLEYKTPTPSTIRDVIYEAPTSHPPPSIKRDVGDDDDVSTDDQQIERE